MAVTLSLFAGAGAQFFDNTGNVLSGGKIYTYGAGTTTPLATYTSSTGNTAHTNPIVLDAAGRVPNGEIWLLIGIGYKFVLKTSTDVLIATYDNIPSSAQAPAANDADSILYEQGYTVTAGSFIVGKTYRIASVGTTNFTLIGATSNTVGTYFIATGVGTGTGTAELSQTVETKLRETVSVMDFGAVGDGVADDTSAVTAALSSGKSIYFPEGTYKTTGAINVSSDCVYYGDGIEKTILASDVDAFGDYNIKPEGVSNVVFSNISFRGSVTQNTTGDRAFGVYVQGCENVTFDNCSFDTFTTHALTIRKADGDWIVSANPNSTASVANLLSKSCKNIIVRNCLFDTNGSNHFAAFGVDGLLIDGCRFTDRSDFFAILTDDASTLTPIQDYVVNDRVVVSNNIVGTKGIAIDGCATATVSNNVTQSSISARTYDWDQQAANLSGPFWWLNYMPRRGIQIIGNVCTQIRLTAGFGVSAVGNTIIRTTNDAFITLSENARLGWGTATGTDVFDSTTQSTSNTSPLVASNNTLIAKSNVTTAILGFVGGVGVKLQTSLMDNVINEDGGVITNIIDPGYANNWNYSFFRNNKFTMSERNGLRVTDGTVESRVIAGSGVVAQFMVTGGSPSKGRFQSATFAGNYELTANYDYNTSAVDSSSFGTCAVRLQPFNSRMRLSVGATNTAPTDVLQISPTDVVPVTDNLFPFGGAANRWTVLYAASGTINTSDKREKQDIALLDEAEKRVAVALKGLIKKFRFKDAVRLKGDNARIHVGVIAQEVVSAFQAEGLDAMKYAIVCYDEWDESDEISAGNRYGVRYEQLLAFIIGAL